MSTLCYGFTSGEKGDVALPVCMLVSVSVCLCVSVCLSVLAIRACLNGLVI